MTNDRSTPLGNSWELRRLLLVLPLCVTDRWPSLQACLPSSPPPPSSLTSLMTVCFTQAFREPPLLITWQTSRSLALTKRNREPTPLEWWRRCVCLCVCVHKLECVGVRPVTYQLGHAGLSISLSPPFPPSVPFISLLFSQQKITVRPNNLNFIFD